MPTFQDCKAAFQKHPREVSMLSAAEDAFSVWKDDQEWSLAALWAIDAARRFTRREADVEECQMAADAAYAAYAAYATANTADAAYAAWAAYNAAYNAAYAAYAAYAANATAYAAYNAAESYQNAIDRLPSIPGSWGSWRETPNCPGFGMAGDYFWRASEGRFIDREELSEAELVAMDCLMEMVA